MVITRIKIIKFLIAGLILSTSNIRAGENYGFFSRARNFLQGLLPLSVDNRAQMIPGISDSPQQFYDPAAIALLSDTASPQDLPFIRVDIRLFIQLKNLQPEDENFAESLLTICEIIEKQFALSPQEVFCLSLKRFMSYPLSALQSIYEAYSKKKQPDYSFKMLLCLLIELHSPESAPEFLQELENTQTTDPDLLLAKARLLFLRAAFARANTVFALIPEYDYCPARYLSGIIYDAENHNFKNINEFSGQLSKMSLLTPYPAEYDLFRLFPLLAGQKITEAAEIINSLQKKGQFFPFHLEILNPFIKSIPSNQQSILMQQINPDNFSDGSEKDRNLREKFHFLTNLLYLSDRVRNENTCADGIKSSDPQMLTHIVRMLQKAAKGNDIARFRNICQNYTLCNPALRAYPWTPGVRDLVETIFNVNEDFLTALMNCMDNLAGIFRYRILNDMALIAYYRKIPLTKIHFPTLAPKDLLLRSSENMLISKARNLIFETRYKEALQILSRLRDKEELPEYHELLLMLNPPENPSARKEKLAELKNPERLKIILQDY
jgi:hypothetical protein